MTPEDQKRAIAKACGWKYKPKDGNGIVWVIPPPGTPPKSYVPSAPFSLGDVPDYLNNLDAMHDVIMSCSLEEQCEITEILRRDVLKFKAPTITASAGQLAEAVLRYLNLWIETPA